MDHPCARDTGEGFKRRFTMKNNHAFPIISVLGFSLLLVGLRLAIPERGLDSLGAAALANVAFTLGLWMLTLLLGLAIGRTVLRILNANFLTAAEQLIFGLPIGLGIFAYAILGLGISKHLTPLALLILFAGLFALTLPEWSKVLTALPEQLSKMHPAWTKLNRPSKIIITSAGLVFVLSLVQSLTPPWDYDSLMYHLQGPVTFLREKGITFSLENYQINHPFTLEMLFSFGLAFHSDSFAKLIHLSYTICLYAATFFLADRLINRRIAWIALAIMLGVPTLPIWGTWAYIDAGWALYEFLSLYAVLTWTKSRNPTWLLIAGITIGFALGSKYLAIATAGLLGLWILWQSRAQWREILVNTLRYAAIGILIASPWYIRNYLASGNPIYPFYFGGPGWEPDRLKLLDDFLHSFGTGYSLRDFLLLPFNVYIQSKRYNTFSTEMPSFLFILAMLYPFRRGDGKATLIGLFTLVYYFFWATGSQQIRFLLPIFPSLSIITAVVITGIGPPRIQRILLTGLVGGMIVATVIYQGIYISTIKPFGVILGSESKEDFLSRGVPVFNVDHYISNNLLPDAQVMQLWNGETYYCGKQCLQIADPLSWTWMVKINREDVSGVRASLRKMGVTHLLLSGDALWFTRYHDWSGDHQLALDFLMNKFTPACGKPIYQDKFVVLFELTCP